MRVMSHPPRTWDDAFGLLHEKNTKTHAKAQEGNLRWPVYVAVLNERNGFSWGDLNRAYRHGELAAVRKLLVRQKRRKPRKVSLACAFARVAERYKISESVCKKYYYDALEATDKPRGKILATATVMATGDVVTNFAK